MKRVIVIQDNAVERIVVEQRPEHSLALRIDWSGGYSSTLKLSYAEANFVAESLQEAAGFKIGNRDEVDGVSGPDA